MRRFVPIFAIAVAAFLVGYIMGWMQASYESSTRLDRVVARKWGDGKYGPAFYGAHVYLEPVSGGYSVRGRVYIGRGNDYYQDCGELGTVQSDTEAVARWDTIDWREDGLHIGSGSNHYFLARASLESHR